MILTAEWAPASVMSIKKNVRFLLRESLLCSYPEKKGAPRMAPAEKGRPGSQMNVRPAREEHT